MLRLFFSQCFLVTIISCTVQVGFIKMLGGFCSIMRVMSQALHGNLIHTKEDSCREMTCYFSGCLNNNSYQDAEFLMLLHGLRWEKRISFCWGQIKSRSPSFSVCIILFFTPFTHMWANQVLDSFFKLLTRTWICYKNIKWMLLNVI